MAQTAGEEGLVDQSVALNQQAEVLRVKKDALENPQFPGKEKVMDVCEVCCNFMSNTDSEVRRAGGICVVYAGVFVCV